MFDLTQVILLAVIAVIALLFWQLRQQGEYAQRYAQNYCKREGLQYLDIARRGGRIGFDRRGMHWVADFRFGFSSDRESRYEGTLTFANKRLQGIEMPVYRVPDGASGEDMPGAHYSAPDPYRSKHL